MSLFMNMANTISEEYREGRLTTQEAIKRLQINADIAVEVEVQNKMKQWKRVTSRKNLAWDNNLEKTLISQTILSGRGDCDVD